MRLSRNNTARFLPAAAVICLGALMLAAFAWLVAKEFEEERTAVVAGAQTEAINVANILNEHLHQNIRRIDQALLQLRDEYATSPDDFIAKARAWEKSVYGDLAFQVSIVDADGDVVFSNLTRNAPNVNLSDRPHFQAHRDEAGDKLHISEPGPGRFTRQWSIHFTRALPRKNGAFAGMIALSVQVDVLSGFYNSVTVGHRGVVTLVGADRIVRAGGGVNEDGTRAGVLAPIGVKAPDLPFFNPAAPASGSLTAPARTPDDLYVGGYSRLKAYPLYVVVTYSRQDLIDQLDLSLRENVVSAAVVGLVVVVCILAIAVLMLRQATFQMGLAEARDRLAEAEERWRLALEAVGDGAWDWQAPEDKIYFSPRWRDMMGMPNDKIAGDADDWRNRVHPDDRAEALAESEKLLSGATRFYANEYRVRDGDGVYRWVLARGVAVKRDDAGRALRAVGTYTDITERKTMETALQEKSNALLRSNKELEAFAYVASHDLRQPLRTVNSYAALLERDLGENIGEDAREFLGFIRDGARRMDRLIVDLLEYSRVGRDAMPPSVVDARVIAEEAAANLAAAVADADAVVDIAPDLPKIRGDEMRLLQLLQNLIGNAIKYRTPGRRPTVKITAQPENDDMIRFAVQDNGLGVASEHFERIFGIFQRLHGGDKIEGSGVGLAICKKIVERHGGRIWIDSTPGDGSVFYFTLPAA